MATRRVTDRGSWPRIIPPGVSEATPEVRYRCTARRTHQGVDIPRVVRWRWKEDDETIWSYCPAGCCEVHRSQM